MTTSVPVPTELPTKRSSPFDPPEELARLREEQSVRRLHYPDGHLGWLVTGLADARAVLSDPRFSARGDIRHSPIDDKGRNQFRRTVPPGFFVVMDPPDHTRYRRLLTGQFTVRRMNQLAPRIEQITEQHLDAMERGGPPADLVEAFALPIPSLVICELLGVPYDDRDGFQQDSRTLVSLTATPEETEAALLSLQRYMYALVQRKRAEPTDDLLTGLVQGGELNDEDLAGIGVLLLLAGHETTANMLALGTFTLLRKPDQLALLRADPALMDGAVEELMRYLTILQYGVGRVAKEDLEIGGQLISAGETVTVSLPAANRDPDRFEGGEVLDVTRVAAGHLGFGHGIHQCLGQQLARIEMRIGYAALLRRFPTLRLAMPPEEVPLRTDMAIYGVYRLPVTWEVAR